MFSIFKKKTVVPHVRLTGIIGSAGRFKQGMELANQRDILKKAFSVKKISHVAISINSPGGSPVQSHLIYSYIRELADKKKVESTIELKLKSDVNLIQKMSEHHLKSGGKRLRALLTLGSAKLSGYELGDRDTNLAACVELIHSATLLHDDVIDESSLRRGVKTTNSIWGNQSSILVGDYLLSRCFEIMVQDGDLEVLQLLSSTSAKIAQGEVLQLQHKGEADLLEETST